MNNPLRTLRILAGNELADSARSRRVIVIVILYLIGGMAGTALFIKFIHSVEVTLVKNLGLAATDSTGGVTATLWKSRMFRDALVHMVDDKTLAETLLAVPPLALFYGWLSFAFGPVLVMITSSTRIAEEISTGSVRFVMFRAPRHLWCLGKFIGQSLQILAALLLSAAGAWIIGWFRMNSFEPGPSAWYMLIFAFKAWLYAMPFLGLALAVSQFFSTPNLALVFGFIALIAVSVLSGVSEWLAGDGLRRLWDIVNALTPGGHKQNLWWNDAPHLAPAILCLLALAAGYLVAGYARFGRRDL